MQKVYLLMGRSMVSEAEHVLGVFSSRKKVDEAISWLLDVDTYYKKFPDRLHTEIFELNGERVEKRFARNQQITNMTKATGSRIFGASCQSSKRTIGG